MIAGDDRFPAAAGGLPTRLPIFPLAGALLLPGGNLPLNIFEPRYLQMTRDAMRGERVIGMIQPNGQGGGGGRPERPEVYPTGCAGRISSFHETDDGRYLISLTGLCRFDVVEELSVTTPYRQVVASYERWRGDDLRPAPPAPDLRPAVLEAVGRYFEAHRIVVDWKQIEAAPLGGLVTSLAMICPFEVAEKQALLEAGDADARTRTLIALLEMSALTGKAAPEGVRH
jgi:Lon protease-like protein